MSDTKKLTRHAQRAAVFEFVFESFFRKEESPADIYIAEAADRGLDGYPYVRDTFLAVQQNAAESDAIIGEYAVGWSFARISTTAKSVLRLAVWELTHSDVPPKVVINEAVEISKEYATPEEASFVNGILNRIARDKGLLGDAPAAPSGEGDAAK